jgi:nuclear GTP-binding protein
VSEILRLCPAEQLMSIYKIAKFKDVDEFLRAAAASRGKLKKVWLRPEKGFAFLVGEVF